VFLEVESIPPPGLWRGATLVEVTMTGEVLAERPLTYIREHRTGQLLVGTPQGWVRLLPENAALLHAHAADHWGDYYALATRIAFHLGETYESVRVRTLGDTLVRCARRVGMDQKHFPDPQEIAEIARAASRMAPARIDPGQRDLFEPEP
jgi:hypothetical protein